METKFIDYAYATSISAKKYKFNDTGCYTIQVGEYPEWKTVSAHRTIDEALEAYNKIEVPEHPAFSKFFNLNHPKKTKIAVNNYFKSDFAAEIGDIIATGSMGECVVLEINPGELEVENLLTKETATVFTSDCDLISRKVETK